ncbi:putative toxin-antitoxin system toxin component, PIN family [Nostoc sp. 'Peltigera membranacea cyanobiont' 213]|uniref:putative toxin-antitoxin system toxin component, PIN family n=1 Tax=Nostoc sp. 'Peltigera membranacea cyanobiont' 213 TaxID=2014530 RepID=UPI000B959487|nr:putative toxin-antitoxin system toxin component, PIN family [Nostoc sp. 'Peltigera membranacea cyanobiont' 213]OYD98407.1 putative toxin-antitoxin system toxin component, PIN family [Nostoc sp. 'Peltigera membranacea cyanobiont' 213]
MKVIIDTNIVVSAAIADKNPETVILFVIANSSFEWVVSAEIIAEYKEVLKRPPLKLTEAQYERWVYLIDSVTTLINVDVEVDFPRDRKDAKFLACAIAAGADFFITGDADFNEAQTLLNTTIISLSLFKRLVCDVRE